MLEPFYGKQENGMLGLGLALVDRIARAHGGRAIAENREGSGARMGLVLPLSREASDGAPGSGVLGKERDHRRRSQVSDRLERRVNEAFPLRAGRAPPELPLVCRRDLLRRVAQESQELVPSQKIRTPQTSWVGANDQRAVP